MVENEWTSLTEDPAVGGQGLPHMVMRAAGEYFIGANYAMVIYALEGHGTGKMIELFGSDKQKSLFLKKTIHRPMGRGPWISPSPRPDLMSAL
jgi:alkylation response protein AidB-like acyl-CoA dehydrogenase